jgi:hypothetical protein
MKAGPLRIPNPPSLVPHWSLIGPSLVPHLSYSQSRIRVSAIRVAPLASAAIGINLAAIVIYIFCVADAYWNALHHFTLLCSIEGSLR